MNLSRVKVFALIPLAIVGMALPAESGERGHPDRHLRHHHQRPAPRHLERSVIGWDGLPSVVPGNGTYAGSVSAVRIKGNGVFIAVDRAPRPLVVAYRAPKARIIDVSAQGPNHACEFQAGVCVIRGDH